MRTRNVQLLGSCLCSVLGTDGRMTRFTGTGLARNYRSARLPVCQPYTRNRPACLTTGVPTRSQRTPDGKPLRSRLTGDEPENFHFAATEEIRLGGQDLIANNL